MIPVSTDAPIYHWPIATVCTIVLNVICFLLFCLNPSEVELSFVAPDGRVLDDRQVEIELEKLEDDEQKEKFIDSLALKPVGGGWVHTLSIEFGSFKPWQWVTNNFMHGGWGHLVGNMIFLWAFGLIVEGKVGWLGFSLIYLGIGTAYGFVLQSLSLVTGWEGIALGASAAIFGLLAFCVAWAPANEFTVLLRFSTFDISILAYGGLFLGKEVLFFALSGFRMSSELLHILGFAVALPIGLYLVKSGQVDCEGWDLFSYMSGNTGEHSKIVKAGTAKRKPERSVEDQRANLAAQRAREQAEKEQSNDRLQDQVRIALERGDVDLAIRLQTRITQANPTLVWKQKDLYAVVQRLLKAQDYARALPLIELHVELFEVARFTMQVAMMRIWLSMNQPRKTIEYLQGFNPSFMTPEEVKMLNQISAAAQKQVKSVR